MEGNAVLTVGDYWKALDAIAPFSTALSWDNVGLLVGSPGQPAAKVLLALDVSGPVLEEAEELGADLIITHHPVVFSPLKRIEADSLVYRLIRRGIAVISAHTNLDMAPGGVNDMLAARLGLEDCSPLSVLEKRPFFKLSVGVPEQHVEGLYQAMAGAGAGSLGNYSHCAFLTKGQGRFRPLDGANPAIGQVGRVEQVGETLVEMLVSPADLDGVLDALKQAHPYEVPAYDLYENHGVEQVCSLGTVGRLPFPCPAEVFAALVKERLGAPGVRYAGGEKEIEAVAVCGGSGGGEVAQAARAGADVLVTGEVKHDQWLQADRLGLAVVEAGHFHTEAVVLEPLLQKLSDMLPEGQLVLSRRDSDGVNYLV